MFEETKFTEMIESGPEILVYFVIEHIGGFTWRMNHEMSHDRIPKESHAAIAQDIIKAKEQQVQSVRQIIRFGVETPLGENNVPTEDYWKWFRWWDSWKKGLSDDEWNRCNRISPTDMTEEQLAEYRPAGRWQDHPA